MARTLITTSNEITVKKYSAGVFVEVQAQSFFLSKFIGPINKTGKYTSESDFEYPIQMLTDLENDSGDSIAYDLFYRGKGQPITGDNILRGNEMKLSWDTDTVKIDQMRQGFDLGGRMSRKRTVHDLFKIAKVQGGGWQAEIIDELFFMYLSGDRGNDTNIWTLSSAFLSFAGNTLTGPQSTRAIYGGDATTTATVDANDKFTIDLIDKAVAMLDTSRPFIRPCKMAGKTFRAVAVLHPYCVHDLRTNTAEGQWQDIVKAVGVRGDGNPIFQGEDFIGVHNSVAMFKHPKVVRNTDWGSGGDVYGARNLVLGGQAGVIAWGAPNKGQRFTWHEEEEDRGNVRVLDFGSMFGIKRCIFTDPSDSTAKDNGMITINTACANPNNSSGA